MTDIRYDLKDYRDLYGKLLREVDRFTRDPNADNLFNTMVTAWSLADWTLADIFPTPSMENYLRALTGKSSRNERRDDTQLDPFMKLCRDIADSSKHGVLDRSTVIIKAVTCTDGTFGSIIFGFSRFGDSTVRYAIRSNGQMYDASDVVAAVVSLYEQFFAKHGLL